MSGRRTIDVHAHFLPPVYREALKDAGLSTLDGGMPVPDWSPERALAIMDEVGIAGAVLSVSSPHVSFADPAQAAALCRSINDAPLEFRRDGCDGALAPARLLRSRGRASSCDEPSC